MARFDSPGVPQSMKNISGVVTFHRPARDPLLASALCPIRMDLASRARSATRGRSHNTLVPACGSVMEGAPLRGAAAAAAFVVCAEAVCCLRIHWRGLTSFCVLVRLIVTFLTPPPSLFLTRLNTRLNDALIVLHFNNKHKVTALKLTRL